MPRWAIDITGGTGGFEAATKRIPAATKKATDKATRYHKSASKQAGQAWSTALKAVGIAGIFLGGVMAVDRLVHSTIDLRNEMGDMSTRTGVAAETLRTLKFASEASGQEFSGLVRVMQQIPKRMADAEAGSKRVQQAFGDLGIETKDKVTGNFREADDVFKDIIVALEQIDSKTEKAARSTALLGRKGGDLVVAVGGGAEQFQRMAEFTARWGADVGPEAIATAAEMQIGYAALDLVIEGVKDQIGSLVIESDALKGAASVVVFWAATVKGSIDAVGESFDTLSGGMERLGEAETWKDALYTLIDLKGAAGGPASWLASGFWDGSEAIVQFGKDWDGVMGAPGGPLGGGPGGGGVAGAMAKDLAEAQKIGRASVEDLLSERAKVNLAYEETETKLLDIMDAHGDESKAGEMAANALIASNNKRLRQLDEIDEKERDLAEKRLADLEKDRQKQLEIDRQAALDRIALERQVSDAKLSLASTTAHGIAEMASWATDREGQETRRAWRIKSTAALIGAGLDWAIAVMNAFADVPYPANIFAAIEAGIQGGVHFGSVAAAAAKSVPSAYTGLDLSYAKSTGTTIPVTTHPGERARVETRSEVERSMRGAVTVVQTSIRGRPVADSVAREVRRGGPLEAEITRQAGRVGRSAPYRS